MNWKEQQKIREDRRQNNPFTKGRYVNKEKGWDFSFMEIWERLGKKGFEQLTADCKDYAAPWTIWRKSDDESVIKQLNLELAVERNRIFCPRCGFPRAK